MNFAARNYELFEIGQRALNEKRHSGAKWAAACFHAIEIEMIISKFVCNIYMYM